MRSIFKFIYKQTHARTRFCYISMFILDLRKKYARERERERESARSRRSCCGIDRLRLTAVRNTGGVDATCVYVHICVYVYFSIISQLYAYKKQCLCIHVNFAGTPVHVILNIYV